MSGARDSLRELAKGLARAVLGDYAAYRIYSFPGAAMPAARAGARPAAFRVERVGEAEIAASPDALIREQVAYAGAGSHAYACMEGGRIVAVCFYWFGARYLTRNFWPLAEGEAKLVQIVSLPEVRGRGAATALIEASCGRIMGEGFRRAYARIWHSNVPSLRAFERAGWRRVALVIEINPLRRSRPMRLRFGTAPRRSAP